MSQRILDNFNKYFTAARDAIEGSSAFRQMHPAPKSGVLHHPEAATYAYLAVLAVAAAQGVDDGSPGATIPPEMVMNVMVPSHEHECPLTGQEIYDRLNRYLLSRGERWRPLG